jgi:transcriptional regulator with XRE-family HTH domain
MEYSNKESFEVQTMARSKNDNENKELLKLLAQKIRYHRKSRGLTQVQLSMDSGVEHRHLQKIEAGSVDLRLGTISRIAKSLNVPACYLLEDFVAIDGSDHGMPRPVDVMTGAHVPVMALGLDLEVKFANNAYLEMTGLTVDEVAKGVPVSQLVADEEERMGLEGLRDKVVKIKPEPRSFFTGVRTKSGEVVRRLVSWNYIYGVKKDLVGFLLVYLHPEGEVIAESSLGIIDDH